MSFLSRHGRLLAVAVCCAGLGAGVSAIATAGASTSASPSASSTGPKGWTPSRAHRRAGWLRPLGRAVHADAVVATPKGFKTITLDRGYVESVSGNTLTIREATPKATYKTVTLTLPSTVKVRNNRQASTLSKLSKGEHVIAIQGPQRSRVIARSA